MENKSIEIKLSSNVVHDVNVANVGVLYAHGFEVTAIGEILEISDEVVENIIKEHNFLVW